MDNLAIYDGVVSLADDDIPVIVELAEKHVRLSASGREIGLWPMGEIRIVHLGDAIFTITAEDETLEFVPNQPNLFAAAVNGDSAAKASVAMPPSSDDEAVPADGVREAPPASPLTMGLFYALCLTTAALAVWSLISIVF